ncbi:MULTISPECIES: aminotransferase class V-fold PLP-dependent enzyme [unclassified Nocardioides]|uniref:aminotransferase class V-fold PLP-dependent enzyme n=1 Tax=unclassified Nocardioides TaxID=2615069 RepID=UPI000A7804F4|nr:MULTISPECIES: aminotransferase class V-fold PLP-dependent enzyme [unclassified Nocardioides]
MNLAGHYTRFRVADRLLLTGHSHQAWPDVARNAVLEAWDDAALAVGQKWDRAQQRADRLREGVRQLLDDPQGEVALGASTHELLVRLLSALDLRARPRLVTTDGEFHSARRQLDRLAEAGLQVVKVAVEPVETLAERLAAEVDGRTAAVVVSSVMFETSRVVPELAAVAQACARHGAELLVDAYHQLGVVPLSLTEAGLTDAWIVGGGYKYLQLGEGNCFLRVPAHASGLRPVVTGWYAEGGDHLAGATYDPTSHYRASRVLDFFAEQGLTPPRLREISLHQRGLLAGAFDDLDLPDDVVTRDRETPAHGFGGFLTLFSSQAASLQAALAERGVRTDSRGQHLRFGPAPYLTDDQLTTAMATLGEVVRARRG